MSDQLFEAFQGAYKAAGDYWWLSLSGDGRVLLELFKDGQRIAHMRLDDAQADQFLATFHAVRKAREIAEHGALE